MNNAKYSAHSVRELSLHIDNTQGFYSQKIAIFNNYAKKKTAGDFDFELGIKGMMHLVNSAAKDYTLTNGSMTDKWSSLFGTNERKVVAEELANEFLDWFRTDYQASK